jgi:ABC-type dipeptide/oligopeptide/nickel transport system permease component
VVRAVPGNPAALLLGPNASQSDIEATEESMGLNDPLPAQYLRYLGEVVRLDFGTSTRLGGSAMDAVLARLPATLSLAFAALVITLLIGFPLGVWAARRSDGIARKIVAMLSLAGQGMPQFWVGIMLILIFAERLRWLPSSGFTSYAGLILPSFALALPFIGWLTRSVRSSVLDELDHHYVRTARAKGLSPRLIFYGHVVRNTLIPIVTVIGLLLGIFIGSAVIVEVVFAWPGVGRALVDGITYRDYAVVEAAVTLITAVYIGLNLIVDLLYAYLDPRIRFARA